MKLYALLLIMAVCGLAGCETDDQITDRVIAQRANMQEAVGMKVLSVKYDGHRRTVVALDGDRAIIFESTKHKHNVSVVEYFAEKSDEVAK
jgi:hypothetical protein